jgi:hypothetical protein
VALLKDRFQLNIGEFPFTFIEKINLKQEKICLIWWLVGGWKVVAFYEMLSFY